MLKNYIKIAFRNLWKYKFYTGLNVCGLSVGIACCLILFQFITYHLSFDQYHKHSNKIYRVVTDLHLPDGSIEYDPGAPIALGNVLGEAVPQIKSYALLLKNRSFTVGVKKNNGNEIELFSEHENIAFSNPGWFNLFDYNWEAGNPKTALAEPLTAVITQKLSEKYFGKKEALGRTIKLDNQHEVKIQSDHCSKYKAGKRNRNKKSTGEYPVWHILAIPNRNSMCYGIGISSCHNLG